MTKEIKTGRRWTIPVTKVGSSKSGCPPGGDTKEWKPEHGAQETRTTGGKGSITEWLIEGSRLVAHKWRMVLPRLEDPTTVSTRVVGHGGWRVDDDNKQWCLN